jgi:hypothetical protein
MCDESTMLGVWEVPLPRHNPTPLVFLSLIAALQLLLVVDFQ